MAVQWYFRVNGKAQGPYSVAELKQLSAQGIIAADTPVRKGEEGAWSRADRVQGLFSDSSAAPIAATNGGRSSVIAKTKPKLVRAEPLAAAPPKPPAPKPEVRAAAAKPAVVRAVVPAAASPATNVLEARHQRRHGSPLPLIIAGVVGGLLLAAGGVVVAITALSAEDDAVNQHTAAPAATDSTAATEDVDPTAKTSASEEGSASDSDEAAINPRAAVNSPEQIIAGVKTWKPAVGANGAQAGVKVGKMQISYDMAWLGVDAERDSSGPELVTPGSRPKFLFVRMTIKNNSADQPLEFAGWNGADGQQEALLVDDTGRFAPLVPIDEAPTARLAQNTIEPRGKATEVLIYRLADDEFKQFRLALPFPKVGYYGLQINRVALAKPGQPNDANELIVPATGGNDPVLGDLPGDEASGDDTIPPIVIPSSEEPEAEEPPVKPAGEAPAGDSPEAFDDLQRSIKEQAGDQKP